MAESNLLCVLSLERRSGIAVHDEHQINEATPPRSQHKAPKSLRLRSGHSMRFFLPVDPNQTVKKPSVQNKNIQLFVFQRLNYSVESSACHLSVEEGSALIYQWGDRSALLKGANNHAISLQKLMDCTNRRRLPGLGCPRKFDNKRPTLFSQPRSNRADLLFEVSQ